MPNKPLNVKACPVCGRESWTYETRMEPLDRSGLFSFAMRRVEYRVCPCGYAEPVRIVRDGDTFL